MSDTDSILFSLVQTGGIITAAGVIMSVAFVGLLFSEETVLNQVMCAPALRSMHLMPPTQMSFMMVIAVLIDTFVIRSLLVPAMMYLFGKANWWPGEMPPVSIQTDVLN